MLFVELLSFNQLNTLRHSEPEPEMLSAGLGSLNWLISNTLRHSKPEPEMLSEELGSINWLICNNLRHPELEPECRV